MFSGSQYDLKKKGFNLQFNSNSFSDNPPKSLSIENEYGSSRAYIYLKSLPTFRVKSIWKNLYTENLFIPIDETEGLEIGMTKEMCIEAFGQPIHRSLITDANGKRELLMFKHSGTLYTLDFDKNEKIISIEKN